MDSSAIYCCKEAWRRAGFVQNVASERKHLVGIWEQWCGSQGGGGDEKENLGNALGLDEASIVHRASEDEAPAAPPGGG